jgi:hypothetical protein
MSTDFLNRPPADSWEADEQSGAIRSGVGGAKDRDQGECGPTQHVLDSGPGTRVTGAGTHTAVGCRHTPKVGAVCGKAARTDLCGGREATRVPTAKPTHAELRRTSTNATPTGIVEGRKWRPDRRWWIVGSSCHRNSLRRRFHLHYLLFASHLHRHRRFGLALLSD